MVSCSPTSHCLFPCPTFGRHSRVKPCMKIRLLMPAADTQSSLQCAISLLIDEHLAIDTGGLPYLGSIEAQKKVEHVLLTHSHIDHIGGLPLFLDNVFEPGPQCPNVYAGEATWRALEQDVFNDRIWPDLNRLGGEEAPFYRRHVLDAHRPVSVGPYQITPIPLEHIVPTLGYVVQGPTGSVLVAWDTAPFAEFASIAASIANLKAICLDASFPNSMQWLAEQSGHNTPSQFQQMVDTIPDDVRVIAAHLKPAFHEQLVAELSALGLPNLEIAARDLIIEI